MSIVAIFMSVVAGGALFATLLALAVTLPVFLVVCLLLNVTGVIAKVPLAYNLRNLVVRKTTTAFSVVGIALVVFVLSSALMLSNGIKKTLGKSGRPDTAIVMRKGSDAELSSTLDEPNVGLILAKAGVKKDDKGAPLGVGEQIVVVALEKLGTTGMSNVQIRGVPASVWGFRPDAQVVTGRPARPGTDEAVVGKRLRGRFRGLDIGQTVELRKNRPVTVVGVFEDGGSSFESEVWVDIDTLRAAFGREGLVSSVRVRLESPGAYDGFAASVEEDKNLGFQVLREEKYYEKQSEGTSLFIKILGIIIAVLCSLGAMIGAMITLYASIADRQREIGTLRALGFSRIAILEAFLLESLFLALGGGALGATAALGMGFVKFSIVNFTSWSEISFSFTPEPWIMILAVAAACIMGLIGGFFPAVRAARVSAIEAMRG